MDKNIRTRLHAALDRVLDSEAKAKAKDSGGKKSGGASHKLRKMLARRRPQNAKCFT